RKSPRDISGCFLWDSPSYGLSQQQSQLIQTTLRCRRSIAKDGRKSLREKSSILNRCHMAVTSWKVSQSMERNLNIQITLLHRPSTIPVHMEAQSEKVF